ncbi:hypothetical protein [Nostoc sp. DedQUE09]|uniref:hypothetical protein n=1 Tax=Nostoc sp. DedQUE09 TaxID=3075394 RepID=UPI002AD48360|nr:hypothetical protein [Nostoc sp. DedQUE09]MDZ7952071.1 hypothetical protein [Nostoc sp. DedQUE09]
MKEKKGAVVAGGLGAAAGTVGGAAGVVGAISASGSVAGLSAAGMTSGLAAIGGGTMLGGIAVTVAAPATLAVVAGYGAYRLWKKFM